MKIYLTNSKGRWDITHLVLTARLSGDFQQIARTLSFSLLSSPVDKSIPTVDCSLGCAVECTEAGETFSGMIVSRTKSTDGNAIDIICFDKGFQLRKNKILRPFVSKKPEEVTAALAAEFGIAVGFIEKTGVSITRNFLTGNDSLDSVITTMYTLASRETKKKYHIGFRGSKLYVSEKKVNERTLIIKGGSNLITANKTESIEDMVNSVQIYDTNGKLTRTVENKEFIKLYGRLGEIVKQTKEDNKASEAQKLLDDNGVSQKITVDCIGNIANVTGGSVVIQEPYTGLYGLFYIESDIHEWKRGQYYNKLVLNFKNMMNEQEAGSLPNANGTKTT